MSDRDYIGIRFGTRVCTGMFRRGTRLMLELRCDCGRTGHGTASHARKHGCVSCCQVKHGYSPSGPRTPTYRSWQSMMGRCRNPNHHAFPSYGGAGITCCDRWLRFEAFLEDMGDRPAQTSLDRIDNAKGYFKENCRWATYEQQQRNKRNNRLVTIDGVTRCLGEWSEVSGICYRVLRYRIRQNWPEDRILSPVEYRKPRLASKLGGDS